MTRFRVDDFPGTKAEEFYRHNLETFKEFHTVMSRHGLGYTLGVIPVHTDDAELRWMGSQPNIDIALHGVNHDERFPNEFRDYQTEREVTLILENEKAIFEQETGKSVKTYIPPHNIIDQKTVNALLKVGFKELHIGPGTDLNVADYAECSGLKVIPSFPPFYGRSDEIISRGYVPFILKSMQESDVCIGLHWTWEKNIGFDSLDLFLSQICGYNTEKANND